MEREWRINGNVRPANEMYSSFCMDNGDEDEDDAVLVVDRVLCNRDNYGAVGYSAKLLPVSYSSPSCSPSSSSLSFIEHQVSKYDTLAGVAIKYGVEVADIKRMNGLVTDLQMFGLKSLQIPLPGRHPPSPSLLSDGHSSPEQIHHSSGIMHHDLKSKSSQQKASAAMTSLQGYYGLKPVEMKLRSENHSHQELYSSPMANSPFSLYRKSRSLANCLLDENGQPYTEAGEANSGRSGEKLVRRRQKSEADFSHRRGLAQRPKAASANRSPEGGGLNTPLNNGFAGVVKKSSSTSNLHDPDDIGTSLWSASKLKLKSDFQALSNAATARPIFDGLPKPITGRRNKAALD